MSKITVNRKDKALTNMELCHIYLPENVGDFKKLFLVVSSKNLCQQINKFLILAIMSLAIASSYHSHTE